MAERTLIEAFKAEVLDDPDFIEAIKAASELEDDFGMPSMALLTRIGDFPSRTGHWPVRLQADDLLDAWFGPESWPLRVEQADGEPDWLMVERVVDEATLDRGWPFAVTAVEVFQRFLDPLRSGEVQAWGDPVRTGKREPISPATWQRPATMLNPVQGEISRKDPDDGTITLEWTAVSVGSQGDENAKPVKNKGGRKPKYDWDLAICYLFEYHFRVDDILDRPAARDVLLKILKKMYPHLNPDIRQVEQEIERRAPLFNRWLMRGKTDFTDFVLTLKSDDR